MSSTFISLRSQPSETGDCVGFWESDGALELWFRMLALQLPESRFDEEPLLSNMREQWLIASAGYWSGCIPDNLAHFTDTKEGSAIVSEAVESLNKALDGAPEILSGATLGLMWRAGTMTDLPDVPTAWLRAIGQRFADLLEGRLDLTARNSERTDRRKYLKRPSIGHMAEPRR